MTWSIEGKQIRLPNGNTVTLEFEIQEIIEADGVLVAILEIPPNRTVTRFLSAFFSAPRRLCAHSILSARSV
ncbi:MAG: hypothetical protein JWO87_2653 [Phycisphaerales bacterium]|nr:hypothetical protein [Phycisphaerales bacterium]MDB5300990.1 hypothetical protein [Phycisphaerales bacterium]